MPSRLSKQDVENFIKKNNLSNKFELIEFSGKASTKSKFKDKIRNIEFECEFAIFKRNLKRNPDTTFSISKEEQKQKSKESFQKKYGVDHYSKTNEFKEKNRNTSLKKYGVTNVMKSEDGFYKQRKSLMKSYGVNSPLKSKEIKERQQRSTLKSTGFEHSFQNPDILKKAIEKNRTSEAKNKRIKTNNLLYGGSAPIKNREIRGKIENTNLNLYGSKCLFDIPEFQKKLLEKKIEKGLCRTYSGKTISEWAEELGFSYTGFNKLVNEIGFEEAVKLQPSKTKIEYLVEKMLIELNCDFERNKFLKETNFKPDFHIKNKNLIIECDGLFWHSDKVIKSYKYHKNKKEKYKEKGYESLFFRSDEIEEKAAIIKSIIQNKIGLNKKVFARKCDHLMLDNDSFFAENHLMGPGSGRIYSLSFGNEIVAGIQVKWKSKERGELEISRFCAKNGISVIGGFSRLLKRVVSAENPSKIVTFIDRRYGEGKYLKNFGFEQMSNYCSFAWTDGKRTYHRLIHGGSSGYEAGLAKIWDCGQARWELDLKK